MYSGPNPCRGPDFAGSPANGFSPGIKKLKCPPPFDRSFRYGIYILN